MDNVTGEFGCNKCVFEKRIPNPLFIAGFARRTKFRYDELYEELFNHIQSSSEYTPVTISQKLNSAVAEYFGAIYK